jgi:alkanesulfonate monooxygenase SsuD/methylene tetrahydromethanopterin reductase-like flavin-dependent oxidoreductase (luciferase family)
VRVGTILPIAEGDGPGRTPTWKEIVHFARRAEAIGVDSIWVFDHMFSNAPGSPPRGMHEAWTLQSALAASTERVELGQLVMCTSFRNPALLAKMAATADEISGGRLTLGLGAGWHDQEYRAFGYPIDHRVSRFEEAIGIIKPLLRGETVTFSGRFYSVRDAVLLPKPARHIPVLVAGKRPRMLRLTARHADAWNTAWFGLPDHRLHAQLTAFEAAMAAEGRDGSSIRRTVGVEIADADQPDARRRLAELLAAYSSLDVDDVLLVLQPMTVDSLDRLGEALQRFAARPGTHR